MPIVQFSPKPTSNADRRAILKGRLVRHRENHLMSQYPSHCRSEGNLRRAMLDAVLDACPENQVEFLTLIPRRLLSGTHHDQLINEVPGIVNLVRST
ncbi:hypothetical protein JM93_02284 [Roseibium hamelinense]|uniref:Uncharacterized protein n=1 Tax=Roseibium hamelinense TaxID=150831 RepID=A0A562T0J0_9HYPH|nr:hypothetical protein [Roseibium hamelinense]MTI42034.1 hypothetical protein [Roseibium hamelinense]TWI87047.1 hypothetical protein JM93_02284 [Roseibium hamelinense]